MEIENDRDSDSGQNIESRPYFLTLILSQLHGRSRRSSRESASLTRENQILNYLYSRTRGTEESEELTSLERRIRRRRYSLLDEEGESQDEQTNPQEEEDYIDFRTYPLTINWKEIYSNDCDACKIKLLII